MEVQVVRSFRSFREGEGLEGSSLGSMEADLEGLEGKVSLGIMKAWVLGSFDGLAELDAFDFSFSIWTMVAVSLVGSSEVRFSGLVAMEVMAVILGVVNSYVCLSSLVAVPMKAARSDSGISTVRL